MRTLIFFLILTFLSYCEGANKASYESCLIRCEGDKGLCYSTLRNNPSGLILCESIYRSCDGGCKGDSNSGGSRNSSRRSSGSGSRSSGGGSRGGGGGSGGGGGGGGGGGTIQF